ncbi:hypothetical protein NEOLEDRAFT_197445 [Neolentinus lepideus HHB14362 ss-1]|uniref:Fungal-type protein kinase domain-containing protein n=1 Tax=Neolentinus lepideus HHB14362 ss-1 TaxID=1314782 RepID=A0A165MDL5_9AGAM|nr:hypothetical protein NEOLEDRAFT_197445 [Neolentinus lepideus HHB14362 ss-1]
MYEQIVESFGTICKKQAAALRFHICANERQLDEHERGFRVAPDLSVLRNDACDGHWSLSLSFVEVKASEKDDPLYHYTPGKELHIPDPQLDVWNQIQSYAASSYRAVLRCFLLAIGIFGDKARFFRWDKSSHLVSHAFNYKSNPGPLIKFLVGLSQYASGGVDQTLSAPVILRREQELVEQQYAVVLDKLLLPKYESVHPECTLTGDSTRLDMQYSGCTHTYVTIGPPVFCSRSIFGRGTRVWLAKKVEPSKGKDKEDDHLVVIKDCWREMDRWSEGEVYKAIHGDGHVFGVARNLCDYDIVTNSKDKIHRTSSVRLNSIMDFWGLPGLEDSLFKDLVHHRCILLSVGIPLWRFSSTRILMEAIRDAIIGHKNMCDKGILHRDVSVNNVMISADPLHEANAKGFLIDPEYAVLLADSEDELCDLTGTYQFTSMKRFLERAVKHAPWHVFLLGYG